MRFPPALALFAALAGLPACHSSQAKPRKSAHSAASAAASSAATAAPSAPSGSAPAASASSAPSGSAAAAASAPKSCPADMKAIPGATFWVGARRGTGSHEESPRFQTKVADFCLDTTEVTVDAYEECVKSGDCKQAHKKRHFCNLRWKGRGKHPINCVDWHMAHDYCAWKQRRLPTEVEWEYAARGGTEYRKYSWGDEEPDGRTCWKHPFGSCPVKSYDAGAFGLFDMTGDVWEWTSTWFGPYPWPPVHSPTKVYRGGSWSRRFDKWMDTKLRDRMPPNKWGSHLGFRCALTLPDTKCPFGRTKDGSQCLFKVTAMNCGRGEKWNGLRCARKGESKCKKGWVEKAGHGCELAEPVKRKFTPPDTSKVTRSRSPGFDPDCHKYYPGRPNAWRYSGGTHAARNIVSGKSGCKNRDVGVGWNSCCCP